MREFFILLLTLSLVSPLFLEAERPNILLIVTDDQSYDYGIPLSDYMPKTKARIFDEGVNFSKAYVTTSNCCPSRSSIYTGMYASRHGVITNYNRLKKKTVIARLKNAGYFTGIVGKYLNSWPYKRKRKEFDRWYVPKRHTLYFDPPFNVNGNLVNVEGYQTYIVRDFTLSFLDEAAEQSNPFFFIMSTAAPHNPYDPAPEDIGRFNDLVYRPPNYNSHWAGKPKWIKNLPTRPLSQARKILLDRVYRRQLECLLSVDRSIDAVLTKLESNNQLENTVIFFISDNGYLLGQFSLDAKQNVYEGAIRVPFAVRYPRLFPPRMDNESLVANIDITPTIYDLVGIDYSENLNGISLTSILKNENPVRREDLLIEGGWFFARNRRGEQPAFDALHTDRYVYVNNRGDSAELYDLETDPFQLKNLIKKPKFKGIKKELKKRLKKIRKRVRRKKFNQSIVRRR